MQVDSSSRGDGWKNEKREKDEREKKAKGLPPRQGEGIKKRRRGGKARDGGGKEMGRERERKGVHSAGECEGQASEGERRGVNGLYSAQPW